MRGELIALEFVAGVILGIIAANIHSDRRMHGELVRNLEPHLNLRIRRRAQLDYLFRSFLVLIEARLSAKIHLHEWQLDLRLPRRPIEEVAGRSVETDAQRIVGIAGIADLKIADLRPLHSLRVAAYCRRGLSNDCAGIWRKREAEAHFAVAAHGGGDLRGQLPGFIQRSIDVSLIESLEREIGRSPHQA